MEEDDTKQMISIITQFSDDIKKTCALFPNDEPVRFFSFGDGRVPYNAGNTAGFLCSTGAC